jgi:hypothetical protein
MIWKEKKGEREIFSMIFCSIFCEEFLEFDLVVLAKLENNSLIIYSKNMEILRFFREI